MPGGQRYGMIRRAFTLSGGSVSGVSRRPHTPHPATMRSSTAAFLLATMLTCLHLTVKACDPEDMQNGCKIYGGSCTCGYGCKSEYIYKTRRECLNALRDWNPNICYHMPCQRGICIQTIQEPGFACKCEGTGYYGKRCEKACPTFAMRGLVFPHECVVI